MSIGKKKALFTFLNSGRVEGWTEWLQGGLDKLNNLIAKGEKTANIGFKVWDFMTSKEGLEIALQGFFGGGAMSVGGGNVKAALAIRNDGENKNIINKVQQISELEASKFKKNLTPDEISEINAAQNSLRADLIVGFEKNKKLINVLNQNEINEVNKNFNIIESSESKIQETISSDKYTDETKNIIVKNLRKNIDKANQEIYNIRNTAEKITQSTETIKEKAGEIKGVQVKDFETTKEVENFVKQQNPNQDTTKASEQQGFIVQNPNTGEQTIVINKEVAKQEKAVNVAAHEFLHAVLYKTVKDSPETSLNLGNALLNELNKIDASQIKDSEFKKRMEQYADQSKDVQMEEALTLFSDAIATGDIKFSENVFTKMGDVIRRSLQKLGVNIKFNNGRDVYNFIKDYNASIAKGNLSLAQIKVATEGAKGKLVSDKKDLKDEAIIKESKAASENVQNIYDEKGVDGSFEIIEQFNPIINKLVQRRSEAPNFNKQDLTDAIKYDDRGILGLIRSYDPKSKVPLAAYVNKFLPSRMIEASNKILGEEFTLDVTEAKGVTAQEAETTIDQPVIKKIKPSSLLKNKDLAVSKITEGVKNIDPKNLTFKKLKDLSPETTAEIFEVPVNKITNAAANLNKVDLSNAARNINKNADKLLRLLPEGAVVEAASEKLIGTSTGVPKSLLDVFYTKQDRLTKGAGLSPYKLNPTTRQEFLEALGIEDGKLKEGLSPRSSEAQRIKSIMSLTGKLITNEIVRSETDLSLETKQDIAAGKSRVMFSKSIPLQKEEYAERTKAFIEFQIRNGKKISKSDPILKNEIKEKIVPELKKLPKELKVLMLYTMQGTGKDKLDGNLGRGGMIYPNKEAAAKALGLNDSDIKTISNQEDIKNALQYAGESVLSTSNLSIEKINKIKENKNLQLLIAKENNIKLEKLNTIVTELANLVANNPKLADGINHILGLQSNFQGHFIRKLVPFVSFTDAKILGKNKIHDEHYSKSLRTTRFIQSIIKKAQLEIK